MPRHRIADEYVTEEDFQFAALGCAQSGVEHVCARHAAELLKREPAAISVVCQRLKMHFTGPGWDLSYEDVNRIEHYIKTGKTKWERKAAA